MSDVKRILYVQPNSEIGGSDICLLRLVRALDPQRYTPLVLVPDDGPMVPLYQQAGAKVLFTPMKQLRTKLSPIYQLGYLANFFPTILRINRLIEQHQIDLVHSNSLYCSYGAFAAWWKARPHVWHLREIPPQIPLATVMYAGLVRRLSTRIASMTRLCAASLFGEKNIPATVTVLHDGIDTNEWHGIDVPPALEDEAVRRDLGVGYAALIGFVARLDPWKGLDVFLRAAAIIIQRFPDAKFIVAGGAPSGYEKYEASMHQLSSDLGLTAHVQFVGFRYGTTEMPGLMRSLDVFVHTSIQPEPFGLVLIEAMASSIPVIAAKAGGPLEIVADGETGILVMPGDVEAYANAICDLLANPQRAKTMGSAGRARAQQMFSVERFSTDLARFYDSLEYPAE